MRIAMVCETLEPGRSGVGDYAWRLSGSLQAQGHRTSVIAFADRYVSQCETGERRMGSEAIRYSRVPAALPVASRAIHAEAALSEWRPDWTSMQFVPYSFDPKGRPRGWTFPFVLRDGGRHHLMVHETWIGQYPGATFVRRIQGRIQRFFCRKAIKTWSPVLAHTSCDIYRKTLEKIGISASILPMFGTINPATNPDLEALTRRLRTQCQKLEGIAPDKVRIAGVFGSIYDEPALIAALHVLAQDAARRGLTLVVCIIGHGAASANRLLAHAQQQLQAVVVSPTGACGDEVLSAMFRSLHLGITTTPLDGVAKSSAAATLRDHGLPVLACDRGAFAGATAPPFYYVHDFVKAGLLQTPPRFEFRDRVHAVAAQLLTELSDHS